MEQAKSHTMLWVGLGIAAIVLFFFMKRGSGSQVVNLGGGSSAPQSSPAELMQGLAPLTQLAGAEITAQTTNAANAMQLKAMDDKLAADVATAQINAGAYAAAAARQAEVSQSNGFFSALPGVISSIAMLAAAF